MAIAMKYWPVTFVLNVSAHCESSERRKCWLMAFASVVSGWPFAAGAVLAVWPYKIIFFWDCLTEFGVIIPSDTSVVHEEG